MENGASVAVKSEDSVVSEADYKKALARIRELEHALGKSTLGVEILKEAVRLGRKKTYLACSIGRTGRFPIRAVAETLEVSRSNLIEQLHDNKVKVERKTNDAFLLPLIREITDERPTYGYRRVTVLLNRKLKMLEKDKVNHKRIYRIMKAHNLLLQRYGKKKTQTHDGTIITLKSNTCWCTDTFSVQCFNGGQVHVAFVMDTCDREVISFISSTVGVDGAMIRDLMVEAVEKRFQGATRLPYRVQWLSDNGPCYTSHETVKFGRMLGFDIRTTPSYSPESNGMSEALVKTTKRDYAWFADLSSAKVLMKQVSNWFEDYNKNAPHKGPGMKSPREFIREQLAG